MKPIDRKARTKIIARKSDVARLARGDVPEERPKLQLVSSDLDDSIDWALLDIFIPQGYWFAIVTEDQGRELERDRPVGLLKRLDGGLLWIEPEVRPAALAGRAV